MLVSVARNKTNRQIGEILAISPCTVNKHLDHVFIKLGVETRAAAAAITRMRADFVVVQIRQKEAVRFSDLAGR